MSDQEKHGLLIQCNTLQQLKELDPYVSIWTGFQTILIEKVGWQMVNLVGFILSIMLSLPS